jgi:hypothetical protein
MSAPLFSRLGLDPTQTQARHPPGEQRARWEGRGGGVAALEVLRRGPEHQLTLVRAAPEQRLVALRVAGGEHPVLRGGAGSSAARQCFGGIPAVLRDKIVVERTSHEGKWGTDANASNPRAMKGQRDRASVRPCVRGREVPRGLTLACLPSDEEEAPKWCGPLTGTSPGRGCKPRVRGRKRALRATHVHFIVHDKGEAALDLRHALQSASGRAIRAGLAERAEKGERGGAGQIRSESKIPRGKRNTTRGRVHSNASRVFGAGGGEYVYGS